MARVVSWLIGELRGSISGQTYSRNARGAYVRARVTGTNPNTVAQQNARTAFGSASTLFKSLNPTVKANFATFASTVFVPFGRVQDGLTTAAQAFTSLAQCVLSFTTRSVAPIACLSDGTLGARTKATVPTDAPLSALRSVINIGGTEATFTLDTGALTVNEAGDVECRLHTSTIFPDGAITDGAGNKFGFVTYLSNKLPFAGAAVARQYPTMLTKTDILSTYTNAIVPDALSLQITGTTDLVSPDFKYGLQTGDNYLFSVAMYSETGMLTPVASSYITIT